MLNVFHLPILCNLQTALASTDRDREIPLIYLYPDGLLVIALASLSYTFCYILENCAWISGSWDVTESSVIKS